MSIIKISFLGKHYCISVIISFFLILFNSCDNDVNLLDEGESIPVVYCLLNPLDEIQYVRVGKTFLQSEGISRSDICKDSIIWPTDPQIYIERWKDKKLIETIVFEISDAIVKDSGLFPIQGLKMYIAHFKPFPGENYQLYVYFEEFDKIVSAETVVMDVPELIDPVNVPGREISFDTISPLNIRWRAGNQDGLYQGFLKMNYTELISDDLSFHSCIIMTPMFYKYQPKEMFQEKITGLSFLQSVARQVKPVEGISREVINFEFMFYASGPELAILINSETGISNPFVIIRNSSNIAGGVGVFSSLCHHRVINLKPSKTTKYFLATSTHTNQLGFKSN